jgi:hypothetical protein
MRKLEGRTSKGAVGAAALMTAAIVAATPLPGMAVDVVLPPVTSSPVEPEDRIAADQVPSAEETAGWYNGERLPGVEVPDGPIKPITRRDKKGIEKYRAMVRRAWAMSPSQTAQAKGIVARDKALAKLLAGRPYKVARMGPWTHGGSREYIGAIIYLKLAKPLKTSTVTLPTIRYDKEGRSYTEREYGVKFVRASELTVLARFSENRLVSIEPGVFANVRFAKGNPRYPFEAE